MLMSRMPKTDPKVAVLRDCFGFSGARERDLSALAMLFDEVRVAPGGDELGHRALANGVAEALEQEDAALEELLRKARDLGGIRRLGRG